MTILTQRSLRQSDEKIDDLANTDSLLLTESGFTRSEWLNDVLMMASDG